MLVASIGFFSVDALVGITSPTVSVLWVCVLSCPVMHSLCPVPSYSILFCSVLFCSSPPQTCRIVVVETALSGSSAGFSPVLLLPPPPPPPPHIYALVVSSLVNSVAVVAVVTLKVYLPGADRLPFFSFFLSCVICRVPSLYRVARMATLSKSTKNGVHSKKKVK